MDNLKTQILGLGASLVGFADLKNCLPKKLSHYRYGISIAIKLDDKIIDKIEDGPTEEYKNLYKEVNDKLNRIAFKTKTILEKQGFQACIIEASKRIKENELRAIFPHKTAATQSGLGWIGKCALLVSKKYGPRIRLVTVLTDAPLKIDSPITESQCGSCTICQDFCPGNAVKGINWSVNTKREDIFEANACEKAMEKFESKFGLYICGICVSRCPHGKK